MFALNLDKIHSYVDIITNSSTVIYTWNEHQEVIDKMIAFLYSTRHDGVYNG